MPLGSEQDRKSLLRAAGALSRLDGREVWSTFTRYREETPSGVRTVNADNITALVDDSDAGDAGRGSVYEVDGNQYAVMSALPDGNGFTLLKLSASGHVT